MTARQKALKVARNQRLVLEYIYYLLAQRRSELRLTQGILLELHRLTIGDMYPCAGRYRDAHYRVTMNGKDVPPAYQIHFCIRDIIDEFNNDRQGDLVTKVARLHFKLTRLHPFNGGNGRVARALVTLFLLVDVDDGAVVELIGWIKRHRSQYILSLELGEKSFGLFLLFGIFSVFEKFARVRREREELAAVRKSMREVRKRMTPSLARHLRLRRR